MKNIFFTLIFLTLTTLSFGQFNADFSATNISGPFDNGEQIEVDWTYTNFVSGATVHAEFQLLQNGTLISTHDLGDNFVSGVESGTYVFTFGSGCDLDMANYTLNLVVSYSHFFAFNKTVNNTYNGVDYCPGYTIPGSGGSGGDCTIPIFTDQLFNGGCCEDVTVELVGEARWKKFPCDITVSFILTGLPMGTNYTIQWDNGGGGMTRFFDCGGKTYTVTISWISADGTSCSVSDTESFISPCFCPHPQDVKLNSIAGIVREVDFAATQHVAIYPNPSNGVINLKIDKDEEVNQIQVFNILGQMEQVISGSFISNHKLVLDNNDVGLRYIRLSYINGYSEIVPVMIQ